MDTTDYDFSECNLENISSNYLKQIKENILKYENYTSNFLYQLKQGLNQDKGKKNTSISMIIQIYMLRWM